ncbi:MAG: iron chelate uptake ABC transporter family permease subunit [Propionibacteriaceae bacterium]|nr:iron chelate uptake ABC transporter family permease subunit [Propionibacteriaceae bacterium]
MSSSLSVSAPRRLSRRLAALTAVLVLLAGTVLASLAVGARAIDPAEVWRALTGGPASPEAIATVVGLRLPRTVAGLLVGLCLGLAGAVIQGLTRNPLADPGILGVNAGAAFFVAIAVGVFHIMSPAAYVWFAFAGALAATGAVFLIGSWGSMGSSPARLVLAGMAFGAVLAGVTSIIRLSNRQAFNAMVAWEIGSLSNTTWPVVAGVAPLALVGCLAAAIVARPLGALALGDDLAQALGSRLAVTRLVGVLAITLTAGAATALAGPIGFVGLMAPHVARWLIGPDQPWIMALTAGLAPTVVLAADIAGRVLTPPGELPAATLTAFVGAPVLIGLARRRQARGL